MGFSKYVKITSKLQLGLIVIALITSISISGYAADTNECSNEHTLYTLTANKLNQFFSCSKLFKGLQLNTDPFQVKQICEKQEVIPGAPTVLSSSVSEKTSTPSEPPLTTVSGEISSDEEILLALVNQVRLEANLQPLEYDTELAYVAMMKSKDIAEKKYFSHTSPTYGSPFDMMDSFNIKYGYAGENIASGYTEVEKVFDGWMNSPGHKANILGENYTHCGFGIADGGPYNGETWTQMFISKE